MGGRPLGFFFLICATLIWGTSLVAQSLGMQHVGPYTFNAVRFFIGGVTLSGLMVLFYTFRKGQYEFAIGKFPASGLSMLVCGGIACGITLFAAVSLQQIGICYTSVGKTGFITILYIVIVPIMGIFLGKKLSFPIALCIAVAIFGMYLLCIKDEFYLEKGDILIFLCAVATSVHILLIDYFSRRTDSIRLTCIQFFACALLSFLCAVYFEVIEVLSILAGWQSILYTGVLSCAIAYTFQTLGQREINPVAASFIFSFEAVFAALAGWIALDEYLSGREVLGCIFIFVAVVAAQMFCFWGSILPRRRIP